MGSDHRLMRTKIDSYEDDTFIMKSLSVGDQPTIRCSVASFFDVLRTSHSLEWELLMAISKVKKRKSFSWQDVSEFTKLRNRLHENVQDPVKNGDGRTSGLAISTLLAYRTNKGMEMMLRRRGKLSISLRRGQFQILPSGMFQAPLKVHDKEYSIFHSFLWEFFEELFCGGEIRKKYVHPEGIYGEPNVSHLLGMFEKNEAELHFTGIAVDLLSLRPEVLLTLCIKDPKWYANKFSNSKIHNQIKYNPEHAKASELPVGVSAALRIELGKNPETIFHEKKFTPENLTPPGAAALWQGINKLNTLFL